MNPNIKNVKPFYIYTEKNCLCIKNINEKTERLANNIYSYSANLDSENNIHICSLDTSGKLIHFFNSDGIWRKKVIHKCFNSLRNIKDLRLYILNDLLNIFIVEKSPLSDILYKVSHFYFSQSDYKINRYSINNIFKDNEFIYKLNIDESSNIIFEYKCKSNVTRSISDNILVFNTSSKSWLKSNKLTREKLNNINTKTTNSNIKDDIFEYCYSIKYKM